MGYQASNLAERKNKWRRDGFAGKVALDVECFSLACGELFQEFGLFDGLLGEGRVDLLVGVGIFGGPSRSSAAVRRWMQARRL